MGNGLFLIIFGLCLVVGLVVVIIYYFSSKRKNEIEEPKYDMMKDNDDEKNP